MYASACRGRGRATPCIPITGKEAACCHWRLLQLYDVHKGRAEKIEDSQRKLEKDREGSILRVTTDLKTRAMLRYCRSNVIPLASHF